MNDYGELFPKLGALLDIKLALLLAYCLLDISDRLLDLHKLSYDLGLIKGERIFNCCGSCGNCIVYILIFGIFCICKIIKKDRINTVKIHLKESSELIKKLHKYIITHYSS